jgi:NitT/TauT family transport system permease protein
MQELPPSSATRDGGQAKVSLLRRMYQSNWFSYVPSVVGLLLFWEFATDILKVPTYLVPRPVDVALAFGHNWQILLSETVATLREILGGFAIALATAIPLALLIVYSRTFERFANPPIIISQAVPKVAIAPLFLVWFGFGEFSKMLIASLIAFFPMLISAVVGLKNIDPEMLGLSKTMGSSALRTFWKIRLPCALPEFFGGFKLAITFSVIGAVIGEFVGGDHGIGYLIQMASGSQRLDLLFAGLTILSALGLGLYMLVEALERRFCFSVDDNLHINATA